VGGAGFDVVGDRRQGLVEFVREPRTSSYCSLYALDGETRWPVNFLEDLIEGGRT
jgi:hypothetical protein